MKRATKLAVILPAGYSGGTMRGAINIAVQIHDGSRLCGEEVQVRFGFVDAGQLKTHTSGVSELKARGILAEPIVAELRGNDYLQSLSGSENPEAFAIFNNGTDNFDEEDFVLVISDRVGGRIAPTYRFGMVIYDFIQRYIPSIFDRETESGTAATWRSVISYLRNYKHAEAVFVTTSQTKNDAIGYGGVRSDKVILLPSEFDPLPDGGGDGEDNRDPFILWTTNSTQHKNHLNALEALHIVYNVEPDFPSVVMTGPMTELLGSKSGIGYCNKVHDAISSSNILKHRIRIRGHLTDESYARTLSGAALLFHPALFDNGTFSVLEAAWRGVPSVSARYPAMEEISRRFQVPLSFFDPCDPDDMAVALVEAYKDRTQLRSGLPSKSLLQQFSPQNNAVQFWKAIRPVVEPSSAG
jgi:glycosyltransferase involved in cell wall biosynthesis